MESYPSPQSNHCHAILNALRAALAGQFSKYRTAQLLGNPLFEPYLFENSANRLSWISQLFSDFHKDETQIICLEDAGEVESLFQLVQQQLEQDAFMAQEILSVLSWSEPENLDGLGALVCFHSAHLHAREMYIDGLIYYARCFGIADMMRYWERQAHLGADAAERNREFLVRLAKEGRIDKGFLQEIYSETVLIPSSYRCQSHDMNRIRCLDQGECEFETLPMESDEALMWQELGINAEKAGYWRAYQISPVEVDEWRDFGFLEPRQAGIWKARGFSPSEADEWSLAGYDPEQAHLYRHCGCASPESAEVLRRWEH